MRKHLLTLTTALLFMVGAASAQSFEWGTATWNIQDGTVYDGIDQLNAEGIVLTYPNPTDYTLTMLNMVAVDYNLYVDDATEPIKASASARGNTVVRFDYDYVEGHSYKIETTGALLAQVNLATFSADTLSTDNTSYTISFVVKGPELVKTIEVEGTMALTIVDQNTQLTYSALDTQEITQALGIDDISYRGTAEAISYEDLLAREKTPGAYSRLKVTFVADENVLSTEEVNFGDRLEDIPLPEVPEIKGRHSRWEDLTDRTVIGNMVVRAEYIADVPTVESAQKDPESGKAMGSASFLT